jgi:pimeloyl-ACP methyl ester carboxylesterase
MRFRLHHEDSGAGEAVLLLHGFTSSFAGTWKRTGWVDALEASGRRVVGLDFPGHGASEPAPTVESCSAPRLAADVIELLDHLELAAVDVAGFSMGAGVALRIAMSHPHRVRRLVVGGIGDAAVNGLHDPRAVARIAAAFEAGGGGGLDPAGERIRRNAELAGNDPRGLLPYLHGSGWPGGLDELSAIPAPVLLFVAEHDQYMTETAAIRRWLDHAEVVTLPGDHHAILGNSELVARVIRFLSGA